MRVEQKVILDKADLAWMKQGNLLKVKIGDRDIELALEGSKIKGAGVTNSIRDALKQDPNKKWHISALIATANGSKAAVKNALFRLGKQGEVEKVKDSYRYKGDDK